MAVRRRTWRGHLEAAAAAATIEAAAAIEAAADTAGIEGAAAVALGGTGGPMMDTAAAAAAAEIGAEVRTDRDDGNATAAAAAEATDETVIEEGTVTVVLLDRADMEDDEVMEPVRKIGPSKVSRKSDVWNFLFNFKK